MVSAISAVNHVYSPYQVPQIAQMTNVQRTRIVEKPTEADILNGINAFLSIQKKPVEPTTQVSGVQKTDVEPKQADMSFGSANVLSIYNQPIPALNNDFFIAYYGINTNK